MGLSENFSCLVPEPEKSCLENNSSLDGAVYEMRAIYQERLPYLINEQIHGFCLVWEETFLVLCRYAMSTDCMNSMTATERELWRTFTSFEDSHTYAATATNCDGEAVGSTLPENARNSNGKIQDLVVYPPFPTDPTPVKVSFKPVSLCYAWDADEGIFKLAIVPGMTAYPDFCVGELSDPPLFDVPKAYVYDDLDKQFVKMERCLPYNTCGCEDVVPLQVNDCNALNNCSTYGDCEDAIFDTNCDENYCPE